MEFKLPAGPGVAPGVGLGAGAAVPLLVKSPWQPAMNAHVRQSTISFAMFIRLHLLLGFLDLDGVR